MLGEPEGLSEIFPRAQPCSPVVVGSMIHYVLLLRVELHILRTLVKGMQILVNYHILLYIIQLPHTPNIYGDDFSLIILIIKRRSKININRIDFSL